MASALLSTCGQRRRLCLPTDRPVDGGQHLLHASWRSLLPFFSRAFFSRAFFSSPPELPLHELLVVGREQLGVVAEEHKGGRLGARLRGWWYVWTGGWAGRVRERVCVCECVCVWSHTPTPTTTTTHLRAVVDASAAAAAGGGRHAPALQAPGARRVCDGIAAAARQSPPHTKRATPTARRLNTHAHTHTHTHIYAHTHAHKHTHTRTHAHAHTYAHKHTHTRARTHTHAPAPP